MLDSIRIVMVKTFHPGNIGSAARAMKTMGLTDLVLVNPVDFPSAEATKMAMSARDVVAGARVAGSLFEAIEDCELVVASSARSREFDLPTLEPEQAAGRLLETASSGPVALVFGPERFGLSNEDLRLAHYRVEISTHPDFSSLNIAAAVQTLSYELYKQYRQSHKAATPAFAQAATLTPSVADKEYFYQHLQRVLVGTGFIIEQHPGKIMDKLRAVFDRAQLSKDEM
ncbi:MAG: RNA methyltransferase, partial [bacterium]